MKRKLRFVERKENTYVILLEIRMVFLDAVIQYGYHNAFAGEAQSPGLLHIHV